MHFLYKKYITEVVPEMKKRFGIKNDMAVPKIQKVVINCGTGRILKDEKLVEGIERILGLIAGQKPIKTLAKKSISAFKIREGLPIGFKITLRGERMYDFVTRLVSVALPRTRDFRGITEKSFDKSGNLCLGIKEHIVFPEGIVDGFDKIFSFEIVIVISAKNRQDSIEMLKLLGFPIKTESLSSL